MKLKNITAIFKRLFAFDYARTFLGPCILSIAAVSLGTLVNAKCGENEFAVLVGWSFLILVSMMAWIIAWHAKKIQIEIHLNDLTIADLEDLEAGRKFALEMSTMLHEKRTHGAAWLLSKSPFEVNQPVQSHLFQSIWDELALGFLAGEKIHADWLLSNFQSQLMSKTTSIRRFSDAALFSGIAGTLLGILMQAYGANEKAFMSNALFDGVLVAVTSSVLGLGTFYFGKLTMERLADRLTGQAEVVVNWLRLNVLAALDNHRTPDLIMDSLDMLKEIRAHFEEHLKTNLSVLCEVLREDLIKQFGKVFDDLFASGLEKYGTLAATLERCASNFENLGGSTVSAGHQMGLLQEKLDLAICQVKEIAAGLLETSDQISLSCKIVRGEEDYHNVHTIMGTFTRVSEEIREWLEAAKQKEAETETAFGKMASRQWVLTEELKGLQNALRTEINKVQRHNMVQKQSIDRLLSLNSRGDQLYRSRMFSPREISEAIR